MPYDMVTNQLNFIIVNDFVRVYTDGRCEDGRAFMGVLWGPGHFLNTAKRVSGPDQTKDDAHIQAVMMAFVKANEIGIRKLEIMLDRAIAYQYLRSILQESDKIEIHWNLTNLTDRDYEF